MPALYWIVNLVTKQYFEVEDDGTFFDDDWVKKTPWPLSPYVNLSAQRVHNDQIFESGAFYGYDLCRNGMMVGVYYDADICCAASIKKHISKLRDTQDVASLLCFPLTKCDKR